MACEAAFASAREEKTGGKLMETLRMERGDFAGPHSDTFSVIKDSVSDDVIIGILQSDPNNSITSFNDTIECKSMYINFL